MSAKWPPLLLHRALSIEELTECFLEELDGLTVVEQLCSRRVRSIEIRPMVPSGGMGFDRIDDSFFFFVRAYDTDEEICLTIGHELGHTFGYRLGFGLSRYWPNSTWYKRRWRPTEELFCEQFAHRWIGRGSNGEGLEEIVRRLRIGCQSRRSIFTLNLR